MNPELAQFPLWDADPVMLRAGPLVIRYYSFCMLLLFATGYALWHWQMRRAGHGLIPVSRFLIWGAVAVIAGGRLVHCLFYEPGYYGSHPLQILDLRRGGLASHGSVTGLAIALYLYSRHYRYSFFEVGDRFAMAAMAAGAWCRVGNFFNSEIVGREWYGPWALRFGPYAERVQREWERAHGSLGWVAQPLPRHPAQLYEVAGMLAIFCVLFAIDRVLGERRPRGLLFAVVGTLYFCFRFGIEFLKEFQRLGNLVPDAAEHVIRVIPSAGLTMGQWLSIPFILIGIAIGIASVRHRRPAARLSPADEEPEFA